jgi:hypothetical protein
MSLSYDDCLHEYVVKLSKVTLKCKTLTIQCNIKKEKNTEDTAVWASPFAFPIYAEFTKSNNTTFNDTHTHLIFC